MIKLIVAIGRNNEMGMGSGLLEHFPEDLKHFKYQTRDNIVVVGRNTFDGFPEHMKEFPSRFGIIITSKPEELKHYMNKRIVTVPTLDTVLDIYSQEDLDENLPDVYISGGARVYADALDSGKVDELIITTIDKDYPDATHYFPVIDFDQWEEYKTEVLTDLLTVHYYKRKL